MLPGLWAPEVALLFGLSLGLSVFSLGRGLLGAEKLPFAEQKHICAHTHTHIHTHRSMLCTIASIHRENTI